MADQEWVWKAAKLYSGLYGRVKDATGRNLKGIGFLLRRMKHDREFESSGFRWHFDHRIAATYVRLPGGSHNEPETQDFLQYVVGAVGPGVTFVDVGTNIGEMVVPMAAHRNVTRVIGFEPHPICAEVCRRNLLLNGLKADVRSMLVGDGTAQAYVVDPVYAPTSGIRHDLPHAPRTPTMTLDDQLDVDGTCVLLIDVEGAELDVMKGGARFIAKVRPLIVFEYNYVNRGLYGLEEVRAVLGPAYDIVRLRSDALLDRELDDTWNCVAVHETSVFRPIMEKRFATD